MVLQMSYEISKICTCEIIDEKNTQRTVFRVIRVGKDGNYKNMDFETTLMIASELNFILERKGYKYPPTHYQYCKNMMVVLTLLWFISVPLSVYITNLVFENSDFPQSLPFVTQVCSKDDCLCRI